MDEQSILLILTAIVAVGTVVLVYFGWKTIHTRNRIGIDRSPPKIVDEGTLPDRQARPKTSISDSLYDGVVQVSAGGHEAIPLILEAGDRVRGVVRESDGYAFDAYLLDQRGYQKYVNGGRPRGVWSEKQASVATLDVTIPQEGSFYLVLDLYGKQLDRDISVRLRRSRTG